MSSLCAQVKGSILASPSHLEDVGLASGVLGIKPPAFLMSDTPMHWKKEWSPLAVLFQEFTCQLLRLRFSTVLFYVWRIRLRRGAVSRFYNSCVMCWVRFGMAWIRKCKDVRVLVARDRQGMLYRRLLKM